MEPFSTTWRRLRPRIRSQAIPMLVFIALTVLTFLMWTHQPAMSPAPAASRPGYGIFSQQAMRH